MRPRAQDAQTSDCDAAIVWGKFALVARTVVATKLVFPSVPISLRMRLHPQLKVSILNHGLQEDLR